MAEAGASSRRQSSRPSAVWTGGGPRDASQAYLPLAVVLAGPEAR